MKYNVTMSIGYRSVIKEIGPVGFAVLGAFVLTPSFGSLITILVCIIGIWFASDFIIRPQEVMLSPFKIILTIYLIYIFYFLLNGFVLVGFLETLISMAPNLPIILLAFWCIGRFPKSQISFEAVGLYSTLGVLLTTVLAVVIYTLPATFEFFGKTLAQHTNAYGRLHLFVGNPLPFSYILVLLSFLGLLGYQSKTPVNRFWTWVAIGCTGFIIVFWSESRGALINYGCLFLVSFVVLRRSIYRTIFQNVIKFFILIICLIIIASQPTIKNTVLDIFKPKIERIVLGFSELLSSENNSNIGSLNDESVKLRKEIMVVSFTSFMERPLFGHGHGNAYDVVKAKSKMLMDYHFTHLHNAYLNHLINGGIFGLLIFSGMIFLPLLILWKYGSGNTNARLFGNLIFFNSLVSSFTNLYFNHDILASFHGILPLLLSVSIITERSTIRNRLN